MAIKTKNHRPFLIRKSIFFAGLAFGVFSSYFFESYLLGLLAYFCVVTASDLLATYAFGLRASDLSDPKQLYKVEKISPFDLDRFYDSRRNIRVLSLFAAVLSQVFFLSAALFCGIYIGVSLLAVLYTKFVLKIVGPVSFHLQKMSVKEQEKLRNSSMYNVPEELIQGAGGIGRFGSIKTKF